MSLLEFFYWLEYSSLLVDMRSSPWLFPVIATIHLFGLVTIGGSVLIVNLHLLGLGLSHQPTVQLARNAERLLLVGILIMLVTGLLLFLCFATKYYYLAPFWIKLTSLVIVLIFTFTTHRRVVMDNDRTGLASKSVAFTSILLWIIVALGGRLIGFP
ncbi:MAG: DUF6644 family protein [Pseudomonadota bacterium]|jgi:uncharacterized membrane protein|nr:DUF6644 family protein [Pseudomonadota bacterium]